LTTANSRVGRTFGKYSLSRLLGKGGMGEVYEAYDTDKRRSVALKILREHRQHCTGEPAPPSGRGHVVAACCTGDAAGSLAGCSLRCSHTKSCMPARCNSTRSGFRQARIGSGPEISSGRSTW